jgi:hypothetical protein
MIDQFPQAEFAMSSAIQKTIRYGFLLGTGLVLALTAVAQSARADVVLFQTATVDPNALTFDNTIVLQGDGTTAGNGVTGGSLFIGADFSVTAPTQITSIGASFGDTALTSGTGSIFGAIVSVDPVTGLPTQPVESLASITLGDVVFTPSADGDATAALSLTLQPGTYGLVFGSGLFGATGVADLLAGNDTVGTPSIFENDFAAFSQDPSDTDVRLFVNAVPEPASLAILSSAGALIAGFRRRRA